MSFPLEAAKGRATLTEEKYPRICAYVDRLTEREGYKRAVQKIVEIEGSYDPSL
jgi:glutathione S-transferase